MLTFTKLMKYRSRTEILGEILQCANHGGCTKTKIMYKAFLSYTQMKEYMKFLEEKDLIKYEEGLHLYRTTKRGMWFLQKYDEMREMVLENNYPTDETGHGLI